MKASDATAARARRVLLVFGVVSLVGVLFLSMGVGTVAADAPDCSTVSYNGDGTEANPYEVSNVDQLQCIEEQDLGANYTQVSDIDASATSSWNGGNGFDPIGDSSTEFTGTFDGADHTISGLYIDPSRNTLVGSFGFVAGRVENVGVENVDITGNLRVGGLVGINGFDGTVRDSYATGNISGHSDVGGLVGINDGTIRDSYATGNVSGSHDFVGGLVGFNQGNFNAVVRDSHATADVSGNEEVGGLVGGNGGNVTNRTRPAIYPATT